MKWWSLAEGKDIHTETGDGYFLLTATQSRPNWVGFAVGTILAAISFTMARVMANFSPPEPVGFWFFLLFGIFAVVFCFGVGLLTWLRRSTTTCRVSDGKIVWKDESGLPKNWDHQGEIEITSIQAIEVIEWTDGTIRGIEFDLGGETMMIAGSLGPSLHNRWLDDFLEAVLHWNPEVGAP